MNKIINIIFILCPPKSGSTLYEILLGSHQEIFSIGERRVGSEICNCGSKIEKCIFWSKINSMSNSKNIINDISENSNPKHFYELFNYILEYTGKKIILDSSKDLNFLKDILKRKDLFKVEIIDLVRNPMDLGLCSYEDLEALVEKGQRKAEKEKKAKEKEKAAQLSPTTIS